MAKTIALNYEGKDYTLEFTRKSIEAMEKRGFRITEIDSKPMTMLPEFFAGAFIAHHKFTKREVIDKIFSLMKNKDKLIETLAQMYNEPLITLMDDEEEEGKIGWEEN